MALGDLFKKNYKNVSQKYIDITPKQELLPEERREEKVPAPSVPTHLIRRCPQCEGSLYDEELSKNLNCCYHCGYHYRIDPGERIDLLVDEDSFEEMDQHLSTKNPLEYPDYEAKVKGYQESSRYREAIITGRCKIHDEELILGVMNSYFMMGSMGSVVGEKVTRAVEAALKEEKPLVLVTASGGARMQEGILSLMQMAKTSSALKRFSDQGGLYICVLTDPTTGGVTASFAMLGDIILAEPKALIGFAGKRVIEQTIRQKLPEDFQTAEFLLEHGFVDKIVERKDLRETLATILKLHKRGA